MSRNPYDKAAPSGLKYCRRGTLCVNENIVDGETALLPVSEFTTSVSTPDGLQSWCKACSKKRGHEIAEALAQRRAEMLQPNPSLELPDPDMVVKGKPFWRTATIAPYLGIKQTELYHRAKRGQIPAAPFGTEDTFYLNRSTVRKEFDRMVEYLHRKQERQDKLDAQRARDEAAQTDNAQPSLPFFDANGVAALTTPLPFSDEAASPNGGLIPYPGNVESEWVHESQYFLVLNALKRLFKSWRSGALIFHNEADAITIFRVLEKVGALALPPQEAQEDAGPRI